MAETNTKNKKAQEDEVLIMIPFVEGEDPEQTVGINGKFWKIKKGVQVKVPVAVANVISNSNIQNMAAMENRAKFKNQVTDI